MRLINIALLIAISGVIAAAQTRGHWNLASIYSVPPPYDIGSGASQAHMGIAAAAMIVMWRNHDRPTWLMATLIFALGGQFALDLVSASSLKTGHVVAFSIGLILAIGLVPKSVRDPISSN